MSRAHECESVRRLRANCRAVLGTLDDLIERMEYAARFGGAAELVAEAIEPLKAARLRIAVCEQGERAA